MLDRRCINVIQMICVYWDELLIQPRESKLMVASVATVIYHVTLCMPTHMK